MKLRHKNLFEYSATSTLFILIGVQFWRQLVGKVWLQAHDGYKIAEHFDFDYIGC